MNSISIQPRPEQIAELTSGVQLPLAPLHDTHLLIIAETISRAWSDLAKSRSKILKRGDENEVNTLMVTKLNALLEYDPIWEQLVRSVTRGSETLSYDGSHLEKRPDLSIHLTARRPSFPLVVECKLLDKTTGKGEHQYCQNGLARFLNGEYAWAAREAFMLGYVRDSSTINSSLVPYLAAASKKKPDPYLTQKPPAAIGAKTELARSSHGRTFSYAGSGAHKKKPGSIAVWHLWVSSP